MVEIVRLTEQEYRSKVSKKIARDIGGEYYELISNSGNVIIGAKNNNGEIIGCSYGVNKPSVAKSYIKEFEHSQLKSVLHFIWVSSDYRSKGIDSKLVKRMKAELEPYIITEVWVK